MKMNKRWGLNMKFKKQASKTKILRLKPLVAPPLGNSYTQHIIFCSVCFSVHVLHFPYLTFGWPALMGLCPFWQPGFFFSNKYCCVVVNMKSTTTKFYAGRHKKCERNWRSVSPDCSVFEFRASPTTWCGRPSANCQQSMATLTRGGGVRL